MSEIKKSYYGTRNHISYSILKKYEDSPKEAFDMYKNGYGNDDKYTYNENFKLGDAIESAFISNKQPEFIDTIAPQDYAAAMRAVEWFGNNETYYEDYEDEGYSNITAYIISELPDELRQDMYTFVKTDLNIWGSVKTIGTFIKKINKLDSLISKIYYGINIIPSKYRKLLYQIVSVKMDSRIPLKNGSNILNDSGIDILTDVKISNGKRKILLDLIAYDSTNNLLYLFDIKSSINNPDKFKYDFIKYKYYIQSSLYKDVVEDYIKLSDDEVLLLGHNTLGNEDSITIPSDVKVLDFRFVVIPKIIGQEPVVFRVDKNLHNLGLYGGTDEYGKRLLGVTELEKMFYHNFTRSNTNHYKFTNKDDRADVKLDVFKTYTVNSNEQIIDEEDISDEVGF